MSWHLISDDQLFTHSRISAAGSTGLFCIEDDERALREEWHTVADLRQAVLKKVLLSLTKREARAARGTTTTATRTEEWLKMCGDRAVDEVGALARRKDAPHFEMKVLRTRAGAVRDRMSQDLDEGRTDHWRGARPRPGAERARRPPHFSSQPRCRRRLGFGAQPRADTHRQQRGWRLLHCSREPEARAGTVWSGPCAMGLAAGLARGSTCAAEHTDASREQKARAGAAPQQLFRVSPR